MEDIEPVDVRLKVGPEEFEIVTRFVLWSEQYLPDFYTLAFWTYAYLFFCLIQHYPLHSTHDLYFPCPVSYISFLSLLWSDQVGFEEIEPEADLMRREEWFMLNEAVDYMRSLIVLWLRGASWSCYRASRGGHLWTISERPRDHILMDTSL